MLVSYLYQSAVGVLPVSICCVFLVAQYGTAIPIKNDVPTINKFLEEVKSTNCRFDSPTANSIPAKKGTEM